MPISQAEAQALLELHSIDGQITKNKRQLATLESGAALEQLQTELRVVSGQLIEARGELDRITLASERAESDLKLVEDRIERDQQRLNQTSSSKDAQGIQSELVSLAKRKSDLEDVELGLLEEKDLAQELFDSVSERRNLIQQDLESKQAEIDLQVAELKSSIQELNENRLKVCSLVNSELLQSYVSKAARGVAVGRLLGRECGGCHMTLNAADLVEITSKPLDEIIYCPECQAILVRS